MPQFVKIILIVLAVLILGYLWLIKPRMSRKRDWEKFGGRLIAHRGLHDNNGPAPENSMAAFRKAVASGYGIELDVQLTRDRIPVVFHDFTLERMTGQPGKVCDYTYEELSAFTLARSEEKIPLFEEFLQMVAGRVPLIIEYKIEAMDVGVCPIADRMLREYEGPYCIESFNPMGLSWYRRFHNDVLRGQLADTFIRNKEFKGPLYFGLQNLLLNFIGRPDFIAYNHEHRNVLSRWICCKVFGAKSVAWTVKSQKDLDDIEKDFQIFIFDSFVPRKKKAIK